MSPNTPATPYAQTRCITLQLTACRCITRSKLSQYNYDGTTIHRTGRGLMIRARHWLTVDAADSASGDLAARLLAERVFAPPITAFAPASVLKAKAQTAFVGASLPPAVALLTVEPQAE
jgi:hypothetical protein